MAENDKSRYVYLVVRNYKKQGSLLYKLKSNWEFDHIQPALEVEVADNIQIITTNSPETYAEYAPYTEFDELRDFMAAALALE